MKFRFQRKYLSLPYVIFLLAFIIAPLLLIVYYAFTDAHGAFSLATLTNFFGTSGKVDVLINSLVYGLVNTLICLAIGYPVSFILADKKYNKNTVIVMLFIMPMWINFILRTGATRDILTWLGIGGGTQPELATIIGLVYNYLPFAILPLYTTMLKMDQSQIEASYDLGATPRQTFVKVILPMTKPGIISAVLMVFMPTISSFVIADMLSEYKVTLFGGLINEYFGKGDYNAGSFLALIMLLLIGVVTIIGRRVAKEDEAKGRSSIW